MADPRSRYAFPHDVLFKARSRYLDLRTIPQVKSLCCQDVVQYKIEFASCSPTGGGEQFFRAWLEAFVFEAGMQDWEFGYLSMTMRRVS